MSDTKYILFIICASFVSAVLCAFCEYYKLYTGIAIVGMANGSYITYIGCKLHQNKKVKKS